MNIVIYGFKIDKSVNGGNLWQKDDCLETFKSGNNFFIGECITCTDEDTPYAIVQTDIPENVYRFGEKNGIIPNIYVLNDQKNIGVKND